MTGILCSSAQVILKAGANANATAISTANLDDFIQQAEGQINTDSEYNWCDKIGSLNTDVKGILNLAASNMAAIYVINYDPNAWTIATATYKLNTLWTGYIEAVKILRETDKNQIFVREA